MTLSDGDIRIPAIIVSSSPHRYGSESTPWEDIYDPDFGRVRYYGDNKSNDTKPEEKQGNKALLSAFRIHTSPDIEIRKNKAVPIIFLERTAVNGASKGYLKFHGYGVIEAVELITQYDVKTRDGYFSNYVFDMCVFSLTNDNEDFPWNWINARRDPNMSNEAKCESTKIPTNGIGIARTISRLKRGWIGVYVTTSPFSVSVQKEVLDDQSPIMLINGLQVSKAVQAIMYREGISLEEYLSRINLDYPHECRTRRPEEILFD